MKKFGFIGKILILAASVSALSGCIFTPSGSNKTLKVTDSMAKNYKVGDIFNNFTGKEGMNVFFVLPDNSEVEAQAGSYTYKIQDIQNQPVSFSAPFTLAGEYKVTVSAIENGIVPVSYNITVKNSEPESISVQEAVRIIDNLDLNKVSDKEYNVRGVVTNVEKDSNGFNGGFLNSNLKFRSIKDNGVASTVDEINGKEVIIFGYLENYNGIYQIPYLPESASPTGQKYNGKLIWVESEEEEETIDVTNVSMSPVNKTLSLNESYTLSAKVLPENATDKSLTWTSSNPNVCSVSSAGVIKGLSVGSAVITAKSI